VNHTTGFDREEIIDLCIRINSAERGTDAPDWPPCLGLFKSVAATLTYMRHNRTQAEIGESLGVSQPTVSRAISAITPLIPQSVREFVPTADDLDPDAQYILDGTLLPCWSWAGHKELYSGKHKTTGMEPSAGSKTSCTRSIQICCRRGTPSAMHAPSAAPPNGWPTTRSSTPRRPSASWPTTRIQTCHELHGYAENARLSAELSVLS
jgi:Helix-turn-helix of DDE superfamily endonuclease